MEFLDLFVPSNIPSYNRATAFLWTIFRYLEGPHLENPFNDEFCDKNPNRAPWLPRVSPQEMALWNVDSPGEKEYAVKMKAKRIAFLKQMAREENTIKKVEEPKYISEKLKLPPFQSFTQSSPSSPVPPTAEEKNKKRLIRTKWQRHLRSP
jgi:hypothetical protein